MAELIHPFVKDNSSGSGLDTCHLHLPCMVAAAMLKGARGSDMLLS